MSEYPKVPPPYTQQPTFDQAPMAPGFYAPAAAPPTTIHTTVIQQAAPALGAGSARMTCPHCQHQIQTSTSSDCTMGQHLCCFLMFITGVCSICSCIPYCMGGHVTHKCPNCNAFLGSYNH